MGILLILKILGIILDVQEYIGNFGRLEVFASFLVSKSILEVKRVFK